jgi:hypothetical protein
MCKCWYVPVITSTRHGINNIQEAICIRFHEPVTFMSRAVHYGVGMLSAMLYVTNCVELESTNAVSSLLHNRALIFSRSDT